MKLFDRGALKITLTNKGLLLRLRAEEILQLVDKTERELVEQEKQVEGKITIGCGEIAVIQLLPDLVKSFHEKYPHVTFDIYIATGDHVKDQMDRGLVDIGLLLEPIDIEDHQSILFSRRWAIRAKSDCNFKAGAECKYGRSAFDALFWWKQPSG